jgi:hypothetical protein
MNETLLGSSQTIVAQSANQSQGFSIEAIDPTGPPGDTFLFTYSLKLVQSNGATTWGTYSGTVINALELKGAVGTTGPTGSTGAVGTGPTGNTGSTGPAGDGFVFMNYMYFLRVKVIFRNYFFYFDSPYFYWV